MDTKVNSLSEGRRRKIQSVCDPWPTDQAGSEEDDMTFFC